MTKTTPWFVAMALLFACATQQMQAATDVYVLYDAKDKALADGLLKKLESVSARGLNTSILGTADYSAMQKVAMKISKSKVVVLAGRDVQTRISGMDIGPLVVVVGADSTSVTSRDRITFVLPPESGTDDGLVVATEDDVYTAAANTPRFRASDNAQFTAIAGAVILGLLR